MNKYKKREGIKHQDFTVMQPYMKDKSVDNCRTKFRLRTEMLEHFKYNYRSKSIEQCREDMKKKTLG